MITKYGYPIIVTPYTGVWIEIPSSYSTAGPDDVTPYTGVWIEITLLLIKNHGLQSLPIRECGLKF